MTTERKILVIDDDPEIGFLISHVAEALEMDCVVTTSSAQFLSCLTPETALIFLDLRIPGTDGVQLLRSIAETKPHARVVLMSGLSRGLMEATERLAAELGICIVGLLQKPFRVTALEKILNLSPDPPRAVEPPKDVTPAVSNSELVEALRANQFTLHYQPQIEIASRRVIGFEALVRWNHPTRGTIFPDAFIRPLEEFKLIDDLWRVVANQGFSDVHTLSSTLKSSMTLSLNVSASSLTDLTLPDTLLALAENTMVGPESIILEVTESAVLKDLPQTLEVMIRLRMNGFQISIDDFGTGYAMMEHLRHIPATEIKIDRSFVQNMNSNSSDRVVVEKTIEIGHELGMKVIAEGVETETQLHFLQAMRCDLAQGYLFSRALAMTQLLPWLAVYNEKLAPRRPSHSQLPPTSLHLAESWPKRISRN